ncbi:MAG: RagB/SusD family nutrient uptake outer membrane protein [Prevotella sp.]|nr:RagB/SusD family nutrient uptake outer membrane protein [Prevotella sp.]
MKRKIFSTIAASAMLLSLTGCIDEYTPQGSPNLVSVTQVGNTSAAFENAVAGITASLCGDFAYAGNSDTRAYDFGLPSFFLQRDVMGQDIAYPYQNWFSSWYTSSNLGPAYAVTQLPWTYYYKWINSCNEVIAMAGSEPSEQQRNGVGIAYAMRAYFYMDLARMFAPETYKVNPEAPTVPLVDGSDGVDPAHNPRATNQVMWDFILSDLDKAEEYIAGYQRNDVYTPDLSVVYGLKARAYLTIEDWPNAEKYAKLAQAGYTVMTGDEYTDPVTGFNTPNASWMFGITYKSDDPNILLNDADSSWGSMMCIEIDPQVSGCGYAANYGQPFAIDRHLYETIPATDARKKCYIDFAIDDMETKEEKLEALSAYTTHPDWLLDATGAAAHESGYEYVVGGLPLKFRTAGGEAGRANQYIGFVVAVPLMRVEEMKLIEAEAAGMQNEARGIELLTAFAKTRDANFTYGTHTDAYYNLSTSQFQNEVWWQRRVELWGEGFATFDIKRLHKGIIRSYEGTNHTDTYRWNVDHTPEWMNLCIVQTETNYNLACTNNDDPIAPEGNSEPYKW